MHEQANDRIRMVQFHQTYSYEDFVQGYRPTASGFERRNGLFHQFCELARDDENHDYVFIIDEINRGNLSKILGELMMLIEADKRNKDFAVPLSYALNTEDRFFVPPNLYLLGLMNTADRSLAMVDYALRRRFALVDLTPGFQSDKFAAYLSDIGVHSTLATRIIESMTRLNFAIAKDTTNLGPGFCIGHSFFFATNPLTGQRTTSGIDQLSDLRFLRFYANTGSTKPRQPKCGLRPSWRTRECQNRRFQFKIFTT